MYSATDVIWVLIAAILVFFMQAGFALCEAGLTRAKNTGNILMKNMMDFCIGTPCYCRNYCIRFYGRTYEFQGLLYLQCSDQPDRIPDLRALDLGRRLAFIPEFP